MGLAEDRADPRWGDTFLHRFDLKVRSASRIVHPVTGEAFEIGPDLRSQSFRRTFGSVVQFLLVSGVLRKRRLRLAAVRLEAPPSDGAAPGASLLAVIGGPTGLDLREDMYSCVGVFSPGGWPEVWRAQAEVLGDAAFYFVEKADTTRWNVFGPPGPVLDLFDPEDEQEKEARAREALASHPRLAVQGGQVPLEALLQDLGMSRRPLELAVEASGGRFQVIEHKGRSYIQRSVR